MRVLGVIVLLIAGCGGGPPGTVVVEADIIYRYAGDARGLAWMTKDGGANRLRYQPTGGEPLEVGTIEAAMESVKLDDDFVYWTKETLATQVTELWRWSRTSHHAERLAHVDDVAGALLVRPDTIYVGMAIHPRVDRVPAAGGPPVTWSIPGDFGVRALAVLDGRVVAVLGPIDGNRTVVYRLDEPTPLVDVPFASTTTISDGHTLYLCDCDPRKRVMAVWSFAPGGQPTAVEGFADVHDALSLLGADARGLYLADGTSTWLRSNDGGTRRLGARLMSGSLHGDVLYGTRHSERGIEILRVDVATVSATPR